MCHVLLLNLGLLRLNNAMINKNVEIVLRISNYFKTADSLKKQTNLHIDPENFIIFWLF